MNNYKRHYQQCRCRKKLRKIENKVEEADKFLHNLKEAQAENVCDCSIINLESDVESESDNNVCSLSEFEVEEIDQIKSWVVSCKIPHVHVDKLLKILKARLLPNIPLCTKTLLKTNIECNKENIIMKKEITSSDEEEFSEDDETDLRDFVVIQFIKKGKQSKTRQINIIPSKWLKPKKYAGHFSIKFPGMSHNLEDNLLTRELVKSQADPPESWQSYTVVVLDHANTYEEAVKKFKLLEKQDYASTGSDVDPEHKSKEIDVAWIKTENLSEIQETSVDNSTPITRNTNVDNNLIQPNISVVEVSSDAHSETSVNDQELQNQVFDTPHCSDQVESVSNVGSIKDIDVPLLNIANITCSSVFETAVIAQLTFMSSNLQQIDRFSKNVEESLQKMDNRIQKMDESISQMSRHLQLQTRLEETHTYLIEHVDVIANFENFKQKYKLQLPFDEMSLFLDFERLLKTNDFLKRDVCIELQRHIDKDYCITKTYLYMLRLFMTKNVATKYTASRMAADRDNPKEIFKHTELYKCMESTVLRVRQERNLATCEKDLTSALSKVLSNARNWKYKMTEFKVGKNKITKLANGTGRSFGGRRANSSKSRNSENSAKPTTGSIENYKRINALTVFLKDEEPKKQSDDKAKINKKLKNEADKYLGSRSNINAISKRFSLPKENDKYESNFQGDTDSPEPTSLRSPRKIKSVPVERLKETVTKIQRAKTAIKLNPTKMDLKSDLAVNRTCSINHELKDKTVWERRAENLKKTIKRIPATQKIIYTFGEFGMDAADDKDKRDNNVDGTSSSKCKRELSRPSFLKRQESQTSVKDPQMTDIEKQLKNIQSQKKKINQLIYQELRDTKFAWKDIRDNKISLLNARNTGVKHDETHINKLCETLEKTTQQVENLHRSFTDMDTVKKESQSFGISKGFLKNGNIEYTHGKGDSNETNPVGNGDDILNASFVFGDAAKSEPQLHTENADDPVKGTIYGIDRSTYEKELKTLEMEMLADSENTRKMSSHSDISIGLAENGYLNNNEQTYNETQYSTNSLNENEQLSGIYGSDNNIKKENCNASSQVTAKVPTCFMNKYPVLNTMLPELFKSEYLRKSCRFH